MRRKRAKRVKLVVSKCDSFLKIIHYQKEWLYEVILSQITFLYWILLISQHSDVLFSYSCSQLFCSSALNDYDWKRICWIFIWCHSSFMKHSKHSICFIYKEARFICDFVRFGSFVLTICRSWNPLKIIFLLFYITLPVNLYEKDVKQRN